MYQHCSTAKRAAKRITHLAEHRHCAVVFAQEQPLPADLLVVSQAVQEAWMVQQDQAVQMSSDQVLTLCRISSAGEMSIQVAALTADRTHPMGRLCDRQRDQIKGEGRGVIDVSMRAGTYSRHTHLSLAPTVTPLYLYSGSSYLRYYAGIVISTLR